MRLWSLKFFKTATSWWPFVSVISLLTVNAFLPSEEKSKEIIALHYGEKIIVSEPVTELGDKSLKMLNKILDNYLSKEIKNENQSH